MYRQIKIFIMTENGWKYLICLDLEKEIESGSDEVIEVLNEFKKLFYDLSKDKAFFKNKDKDTLITLAGINKKCFKFQLF